jgi:hypothetical protein
MVRFFHLNQREEAAVRERWFLINSDRRNVEEQARRLEWVRENAPLFMEYSDVVDEDHLHRSMVNPGVVRRQAAVVVGGDPDNPLVQDLVERVTGDLLRRLAETSEDDFREAMFREFRSRGTLLVGMVPEAWVNERLRILADGRRGIEGTDAFELAARVRERERAGAPDILRGIAESLEGVRRRAERR